MRKTALLLLLVLSLVACASKGPGANSDPNGKAEDMKPAPEFELASLSGGTVKSSDLKGKVAIIDFWATWCSPCVKEIPNFNKLHAKHDGEGVRMLGITVESGSLEDVKPYVAEYGMKYPVVMGKDAVVEGFGGLIGFPTTFVVTKDWKIYKRYLGMTPNKEQLLEKDIESLLKE